ncbi:carbohydrate ABC transporter permease [Cellulomonas sp. PhB143]|uniref:carbohydrate ABC transporter permease n=1 Tax=Cellulomonas sp. PhB143 TaxID=2485186 RepID=UPI000FA6C2A1|nr:carbohydrate ABC transporter permease [Cellulomonas sp. PhB143]ROS76881.1 xylobiose transport system permease protein [Cellulomonas sp. PhB143]
MSTTTSSDARARAGRAGTGGGTGTGGAAGTGDGRPRQRLRRERREAPAPVGWIGAMVWFVIVAVPLYFLITTSLRTSSEYLLSGPMSVPKDLSFASYRLVLESGFGLLLLNTAIVTVATVAIVLALSLPAAYAIVRSRSRFVRRTFSVVLLGLAIPAQATIIPIYLMITQLHMYDTLLAIVLPTAAFAIPLSILVLTASLRDVPGELYEAMNVDGASPARTFWTLALPLSRGGITTVGIYTAMGAWNGFIFPLVLTQSESVRVLTLGLWTFQSQYGVNVPAITAAVTLSLLPLLALYLIGRRQLLSGLTAGFGK